MKLKHHKLRIIRKAIREVYNFDKGYIIDNICSGVLSAVFPFINVYMGKLIIDSLIDKNGSANLLRLVLITIAANAAIALANKFFETDGELRGKILVRNRDMKINEKIIKLDYELVEKEETNTKLTELKDLERYGHFGVIYIGTHLNNIIKGVLTVIIAIIMSMGLFSARVEGSMVSSAVINIVFVSLILFAAIISILSAQGVNNKMSNLATDEILEVNTIGNAYCNLIFDYKFGKDLRLYTSKLYLRAMDGLNNSGKFVYAMFAKVMLGPRVLTSVCSILSIGFIYCFIGYKAYYRAISIGEIMQYIGAISQMLSGVILLSTTLGELINNNYFFEKLFDFYNLNSNRHTGTLPVEKRDDNEYTLELKNVSFKYPGTDKYVLKNINMKLKIGEKLAIVGMNGSGKTTFIKLLARFYDPCEGEILLNGINIKKYDYDEYIRLFSVVFQDFKLFSFTLGQNIASSVQIDEIKADFAIKQAGFEERYKEMQNGLEIYLYRDFDENGIEISGGEAQKIAMARALYKDAPFVILDEPTAALDPISEFEVYSKFDEIVKGKTAIYISHRLSSCRFSHNIAVFHEGEIIQVGSHEELIQDRSGKYHELWNAQAQYYKDEEKELLMA